MASLSWTTLAMLMACPHMSQSFGFALSCAAVLGIVLFADTLNAWMEPVLPRFVAEALSMTIAAQVFTLPIQVLIEPELPVFSIPANLMVAPVRGFRHIGRPGQSCRLMADSVARPATGPCGLLGHRGHGTDRPLNWVPAARPRYRGPEASGERSSSAWWKPPARPPRS